MTPKKREWKPRFLEGLREHGNVTRAARGANITRQNAYLERKNHTSFGEAWEEALEEFVDSLEDEMYARAKDGSDTLLIFALKGRRAEVYGEKVRQEVTGKGGGPVTVKVVYDD